MTSHFTAVTTADHSINPEPDLGVRWRLGLITDPVGHVHVGAAFPASPGQPEIYVDLLAAVGAASVADLDLDQFSVVVQGNQGNQFADLRRIIVRCIDDARLRQRLLELVSLSESRS